MKKILILAPHIDDEMIGCYTVIENTVAQVEVVYFFDQSPQRIFEAERLAEEFNIYIRCVDLKTYEIPQDRYDAIYIPSRRDQHAHHKAVNAKFRHLATHFYSVDMDAKIPLPPEVHAIKCNVLHKFYPSQAALFQDEKYWRFEDIRTQDFDEYWHGHYDFDGLLIRVTTLCKYEDSVDSALIADSRALVKCIVARDKQAFNKLVGLCPEGLVRVEHMKFSQVRTTWEVRT